MRMPHAWTPSVLFQQVSASSPSAKPSTCGLALVSRVQADLFPTCASDATVYADEVFGFHAQQAVEKALKAWLCLRGQRYPFTHDINELLSRLSAVGEEVDQLRDLDDLSDFAMGLRYGPLNEHEPPLDRRATLRRVEAVLDQVRALIAEG